MCVMFVVRFSILINFVRVLVSVVLVKSTSRSSISTIGTISSISTISTISSLISSVWSHARSTFCDYIGVV